MIPLERMGGDVVELSRLDTSCWHNSFLQEEYVLVVTQVHAYVSIVGELVIVSVFLQVVIIFLQKMDVLLAKTPKDDVRDHVLPMVCKALEAPDIQLQVHL